MKKLLVLAALHCSSFQSALSPEASAAPVAPVTQSGPTVLPGQSFQATRSSSLAASIAATAMCAARITTMAIRRYRSVRVYL